MWWAYTTGDVSRDAMILACAQGAGMAPLPHRTGQSVSGPCRRSRLRPLRHLRGGGAVPPLPCTVGLVVPGAGLPERGG
jgi:DNA-binding transcriptional LysR family regulator